MGPKKQPVLRAFCETQGESNTGQMATSTSPEEGQGETIEGLSKMLQSFMQSQQAREDLLQKEAQRQEHRWRTLQHHFIQLQSEVQQQRQDQQTLGGATAADSLQPSTAAPPTQRSMP